MKDLRTYFVNDQFFETINTEGKAYWLGFLAADGCIRKKRPDLILKLSIKDKGHLKKFQKTLISNYPIRDIKGSKNLKKSCRISIRSKKMVRDLADKGVIPCKSLILKPPKNVPNNLIYHWIRGYFDGDGSVFITKRKNRNYFRLGINIVGTREVLKFILFHTKLTLQIRRLPNSKAYWVQTNSIIKGLQFYNYLYKEAIVYLERKKDKFEKYIKIRKEYQKKRRGRIKI